MVGADAEADLWFSPLVNSRSPAGITLDDAVRRTLRAALKRRWREHQLPEDRAIIRRAQETMARVHQNLSPALAVEEKVAWLSITGDRQGIEGELGSAVAALATGSRSNLAAWASQAWDRLPDEARATRAGWVLLQAARVLQAARGLRPLRAPAGVSNVDLAAVLSGIPDVQLGLRRRFGLFEIGEIDPEGAAAIMVPDTDPRVIELLEPQRDEAAWTEIRVRAGSKLKRNVGTGTVLLRTLRGAVYELPPGARPESPGAATFAYDAFLSYASEDKHIVEQLERELALRSVRLFVDRSNLRSGEQFSDKNLRRALEESRNLLVVWSERARRSRWVDGELALFRKIRRDGSARGKRIFLDNGAGEPPGPDDFWFRGPPIDATAGWPPHRLDALAALLRIEDGESAFQTTRQETESIHRSCVSIRSGSRYVAGFFVDRQHLVVPSTVATRVGERIVGLRGRMVGSEQVEGNVLAVDAGIALVRLDRMRVNAHAPEFAETTAVTSGDRWVGCIATSGGLQSIGGLVRAIDRATLPGASHVLQVGVPVVGAGIAGSPVLVADRVFGIVARAAREETDTVYAASLDALRALIANSPNLEGHHAIAAIDWQDAFPGRDDGLPRELSQYTSTDERLADLFRRSGTLWLVARLFLTGSSAALRLVYRIDHAVLDIAADTSTTAATASHRVRASEPNRVVRYGPNSFHGVLSQLSFARRDHRQVLPTMVELARQLDSIRELRPDDVTLLEAYSAQVLNPRRDVKRALLSITEEPGSGLRYVAVVESERRVEALLPRQVALIDQLVASAIRSTRTDEVIGRTLFALLVPGEIQVELGQLTELELRLDAATARYPWELLNDQAFPKEEPLAVRTGLVRRYIEPLARRDPAVERGAPVRTEWVALVIGDPQSEFPILPQAREEAEAVAKRLSAAGLRVRSVVGASTEAVVSSLFAEHYSLLHVAANGVYQLDQGPGRSITGIPLGSGAFLTAAELAQMRIAPEFVFLNACHLGLLNGKVEGQLGVEHNRFAASIAGSFLQAGVKVFVAPGWVVDDRGARMFAEALYDGMLAGRRLLEAVRDARRKVYQELGPLDENAWGVYHCYGDPNYRLGPVAGSRRTAAEA
jgi:hypothetical protein